MVGVRKCHHEQTTPISIFPDCPMRVTCWPTEGKRHTQRDLRRKKGGAMAALRRRPLTAYSVEKLFFHRR